VHVDALQRKSSVTAEEKAVSLQRKKQCHCRGKSSVTAEEKSSVTADLMVVVGAAVW